MNAPQGMNRQAQDVVWLRRLQVEGVEKLVPHPIALSAVFFKGVEQFNDGLYWRCHETLEEVWRATEYPQRLFYYALIKVAVGFVHLGRHNERSAISQFSAAEAYLKPFLPVYVGVRSEPLHREVTEWLRKLRGAAPLPWPLFDQAPRPKIQFAKA